MVEAAGIRTGGDYNKSRRPKDRSKNRAKEKELPRVKNTSEQRPIVKHEK